MRDAVEKRNIEYVWHFTRLANVDGILTNGLINRQQITQIGMPSEFNDTYRIDGHEDSICCSVGHPNYKMFYRLRMENPDIEWAVIGIQARVLWEKDCAFCVSNAACNSVTCIPIEQRKGVVAFNRMFDEVDGKPTREVIGLSDNCPTNPQAEVLVFGNIEPEYIIGVVTQTKDTEKKLMPNYPNFKILYHKAHFSPRKGYEHWR